MTLDRGHYEVKTVHPRVAYYLQSNGWLYIHEYESSEWGTIDFLAIHKTTGAYCIIECKRVIENVNAVVSQLKRYQNITPNAQLIAVSMEAASLRQIAKFSSEDVAYMHIPESAPSTLPLPPSKTYEAFNKCLQKFHGYGIYPSRYKPVEINWSFGGMVYED